ncbi:MAG: hypothetical protein VW802_07055 [Rhodospirillaceae bacterium]|jgi:hypothetical protein
MAISNYRFLVIGMAFAVASCGFAEESLWPSLTGEDPSGQQAKSAPAKAPAKPAATSTAQASAQAGSPSANAGPGTKQPPLGNSNFQPSGVTPGQPTGTVVGKKIIELREELKRLQTAVSKQNMQLQRARAKVVQGSRRYHASVASINSRLQIGTTPGNPILVRQYNSAQADLDRLSGDLAQMNALSTAIANDSTMSSFLSESVKATFTISGAVDEDHRQLAILEDEVNRTVILIERLHKEVVEDVRRQSNYVATERSNLNLLASGIRSGEIYGASLANQAMVASAGGAGGLRAIPPRPMSTAGRRPLVVIRFDRPNVPYQQALYTAVSRVLERRPNATFDLVAVAPSLGGKARAALNKTKSRRYAESVMRSLVEMGMPPSRIAMSTKVNGGARSNEVHLYLR